MTGEARFNIGEAVTASSIASGVGHRVALTVAREDGRFTRFSFEQLADLVARFHAFIEGLRVAADARVLIRLPNVVEFPLAFLGSIHAGRIATPTSTLLTPSEVAFIAEDSQAEVLVTTESDWAALSAALSAGAPELRHVVLVADSTPSRSSAPEGEALASRASMASDRSPELGLAGAVASGAGELAAQTWALHDFATAVERAVPAPSAAPTTHDDPAYLVYTSGTTGFPKGVLHAHRSLIGRGPARSHWFDFAEHDTILHSGKFNWTYVLGTGLMDPLFLGHSVVVYEGKNDPSVWPELIRMHGCTIFIGVPTLYRQILRRTDASATSVPSLRRCMSAGEHLPDDVLEAWQERFGIPIHQGLGMTEYSYYISQHPSVPLRAGSTGRIQPGRQVSLVDDDLNPVPAGTEGMLVVRESDPGLFLRYWTRPEENRESRRSGVFLTGDYATIDADGYVWFNGRRDDLINSFGYRVSPYEIERVMKSHPSIEECVAFGEDVGEGKIVVSLCVVRAAGEDGDAALDVSILRFGAERLASYKAPKKLHFVTSIPRNRNGKVLRKQLIAELIHGTHGPR